jgi:hypothetical protein
MSHPRLFSVALLLAVVTPTAFAQVAPVETAPAAVAPVEAVPEPTAPVSVAPVQNPNLAFSAFPNPDLNALDGGQILQARGGLIDFQRGVTSQALYLIHAPIATVQQKLLSWNPARHPELDMFLHLSLPPQPVVTDFSGLNTLPDVRSVDNLVTQLVQLDATNPGLQLNPAEAAAIVAERAQVPDKRVFVVSSLSQVLAGRVNNFLAGGSPDDIYVSGGVTIRPLDEIRSLVRSDSRIYREFHPVLALTPVLKGHGIPVNLYYECFDVEGTTAVGTGAIFQLAQGPSVLSANLEFYDSSGIYASAELEQLWPVMVNGHPGTLVWRADQISTANVAYLHGTERLASGMLMLQDVKSAIQAFRSEF